MHFVFFGKGNEGESQNPHQTLVIINIAKPMLCHFPQCYHCLFNFLINFELSLLRNFYDNENFRQCKCKHSCLFLCSPPSLSPFTWGKRFYQQYMYITSFSSISYHNNVRSISKMQTEKSFHSVIQISIYSQGIVVFLSQ